MQKKNLGVLLIVCAALATVVVVVVMLVRGPQESAETTSAPTPAAQPEQNAQTDQVEDAGSITTDPLGRQVFVPSARGGDVLSSTADDGGTCQDIRRPEALQIQRINAYPVLFSTDTGPTEVVNSTPSGYAEGPRGAVLAGINTYMLMMSGGTPSKEIARAHILAEREVLDGLRDAPAGFNPPELRVLSTVAYRVRSCTDRAVVIEYAMPQMGDESGVFPEPKWRVISTLVVKDEGRWKLSVSNDAFHDLGFTNDREGFTEWNL